MELLNESVTKELVRTQLKVYMETSEGIDFAKQVINDAVKHYFYKGYGNSDFTSFMKNQISVELEELIPEFITNYNIHSIFVLGMVKMLEESGYKVEICKKH